jgi:branched-chain amino acid transport system permease protein
MITLGIGELVWASSLMFPEFFGGEGRHLRTTAWPGPKPSGITFGPQIQLYYLIASTPSSARRRCSPSRARRWAHAERGARQPRAVEFVGYDTQKVRYIGLHHRGRSSPASPGGLAALNFEIVTSEVVSGRARAPTCCSPSSAAPPSSSARSSAAC